MRKKALARALLGFPLGVFLSYTITIVISLVLAGGSYSAVVPSLVESTGSELNAVLLQYLLSGLLGMGFAGSSVVWENEQWSLFHRTLVHLVVSAATLLPVAYLTHWMEPTLLGFFSYILVFMAAYAIIWLAQWLFWMWKIRQINIRLSGK